MLILGANVSRAVIATYPRIGGNLLPYRRRCYWPKALTNNTWLFTAPDLRC
jgi:hypothetical protein